MSFNKRWVILDRCLNALKRGGLKEYYGKSDMLVFQDKTSELIYELYSKGKTDKEILIIINELKIKENG